MNKQIILTIFAFLLIGSFISLASSEMQLWNNVIIDKDNSVVKYHAFYTFEDTSASGIGKNKDIPVTLWVVVEPLPYILTGYSGIVDWCNFTTSHYANVYDSEGNYLNYTTETTNIFYENTTLSSNITTINMRSRDSLIADISCHYTDSNYLYVENALIGRFTTYMPSFECNGCTQYSLEELSNQADRTEEITANELSIYTNIQKVVDWNYTIWLVISWIIKIGLILLCMGLIFSGVYYFYLFLQNIGKAI